MAWLEGETHTADTQAALLLESGPGEMDPDGLLAYLRETAEACLDPVALVEGEFPERFLTNALEALTTFAVLDAWLSDGRRPPLAWCHRPPLALVPATGAPTGPDPRKDPTP
jgi:hypothetical protein